MAAAVKLSIFVLLISLTLVVCGPLNTNRPLKEKDSDIAADGATSSNTAENVDRNVRDFNRMPHKGGIRSKASSSKGIVSKGPSSNMGIGSKGPSSNMGIGSKGPSSNMGIGSKGPSSNMGIGSKGSSVNDVGSTVFGSSGFSSSNGFGSNGFSSTGFGGNGFGRNSFSSNNGYSSSANFGSSSQFPSYYKDAMNAAQTAAAAAKSLANDFPDDWNNWYSTLKNMQKELNDCISGWHNDGGFPTGSSSVTSTTSGGVTIQCTSVNGGPEKCTTVTTGDPSLVGYESPDGSSSNYAYSWSSDY